MVKTYRCDKCGFVLRIDIRHDDGAQVDFDGYTHWRVFVDHNGLLCYGILRTVEAA